MSSQAPPIVDDEECRPQISFFQWPDYVVLALMLLVSAAIGIFFGIQARRQKASTDDILVGGRQMATFPMAMSLLASFMSAVTLLGNPAEMYNYGTQFVVIGVGYIMVSPVTAYVFMPVYHRLALTSAYEYLEMRFNKWVRLIGCVIFTLHMITYLPIVVYAPALALNQVTGLDTYAAVSIIFAVCIFYTSVGGIKAVIWTDTFQVLMMFAGMMAVVFKGTVDVGGADFVWQKTVESGRAEFFNMNTDPRERHSFWTMTVGGSFLWIATYAASQAQIQRFLTVPTEKQAVRAIWINCIGLVALLLVCCWGGLVMYANYFDCDPLISGKVKASDQLLPLFVMDTMGSLPGMPGLFTAGIFSGSLSTVSTGLSSLAAITLKDFLIGAFKMELKDSRQASLAKWISLIYGIICFGIVFLVAQIGGVLQAALSVNGMVGGPILGLFSLGILIPWVNWKGAFSGGIVGLVFVGWMGFGAQVEAALGNLSYPKKLLSVAGCNCTTGVLPAPPLPGSYPDIFPLYAVSYMWYAPIGWCITTLIGIAVSWMTKFNDPREMDKRLFSPVLIAIMDKLPLSWQEKVNWPLKPAKKEGCENSGFEFEAENEKVQKSEDENTHKF
ncbi:sodium-coupled monocarboxylate transporter 1-like isoform X1 [Neocloeon triangulifer]|uniref:sodium-coupled monocarboxylate transporter 1-like isoform X1 n=2 Tax=Neocloeon triangulifer TaxID=2078957 RepID=UPI00286EEEB1|nr:sodium-coupled monocarboxylate transporter 1-like isoform X1 [Neocloeon triangulifer]